MSNQPDPRRWKALGLLCLAFFMVILDAQIVILGLPSIEADLGLSAAGAQWVLSAYLLCFGGLLLLGGRSADYRSDPGEGRWRRARVAPGPIGGRQA